MAKSRKTWKGWQFTIRQWWCDYVIYIFLWFSLTTVCWAVWKSLQNIFGRKCMCGSIKMCSIAVHIIDKSAIWSSLLPYISKMTDTASPGVLLAFTNLLQDISYTPPMSLLHVLMCDWAAWKSLQNVLCTYGRRSIKMNSSSCYYWRLIKPSHWHWPGCASIHKIIATYGC